MKLLFKRLDGSFVAEINGMPYHVEKRDPLYARASEVAGRMGKALGAEPPIPEPAPARPLPDATAKLAAFLSANPDVLALVTKP